MAVVRGLHATATAPPSRWSLARAGSLCCAGGLIALALCDPSLALIMFWSWCVPAFPLLFLIAPGVWRNICPLATVNGLPRRLGLRAARRLPPRIGRMAPVVSAVLFLMVVGLRTVALDRSGAALALFFLLLFACAFLGGTFFAGKSGWCSQFCPMLQVERFYGISPLGVVRDTHCRPCNGCTKGCYDLMPTTAGPADLYAGDRQRADGRTVFAGALPWICLGFFTAPSLAHPQLIGVLGVYGRLVLLGVLGVACFRLLDRALGYTSNELVLVHAVVALNLFYWFMFTALARQVGAGGLPVQLMLQTGLLALSLAWFQRAVSRERDFRHHQLRRIQRKIPSKRIG